VNCAASLARNEFQRGIVRILLILADFVLTLKVRTHKATSQY